MARVRFNLSDEQYAQLHHLAQCMGVSDEDALKHALIVGVAMRNELRRLTPDGPVNLQEIACSCCGARAADVGLWRQAGTLRADCQCGTIECPGCKRCLWHCDCRAKQPAEKDAPPFVEVLTP